jgi:mono/diheme cytochrome c family protein
VLRTTPIWLLIGILASLVLVILDSPRTVAGGLAAKDRGAQLFTDKGCSFCHGPAGVGGGIGPDLQLVRKRRTRDQIVAQIQNGGKSMPNFGDKLSTDEINDLVAFLLAKRKFIAAPKTPAPTSPTSKPPSPSPN